MFREHVWDGSHTEDGIFLFRGDGVNAGRLPPFTVLDIAPTVLAWHEIPAPLEMDGHAIAAVLGGRSISTSDETIYRRGARGHSGAGGEEAVRERLEALGYL